MSTKTYRGRSLEELLPKVRAELGPDAVIVRQREGLTGGIAGFFQRKLVEIEAEALRRSAPGHSRRPAPDTARLQAASTCATTPPPRPTSAREARPRAGAPLPASAPRHPRPSSRSSSARSSRTTTPGATGATPRRRPPSARSSPSRSASCPSLTPHPPRSLRPRRCPLPRPPTPPRGRPPPRSPSPRAAPPFPPRCPRRPRRCATSSSRAGSTLRWRTDLVEETVTHLVPLAAGARLKPLVVTALAQRIPVAPLGGLGGRVVAFVGPGGSGKTNCTGRLAEAYAAADRMPVACVSLGARDGGAELALLLAPSGVPLHTASHGAEAAEQDRRAARPRARPGRHTERLAPRPRRPAHPARRAGRARRRRDPLGAARDDQRGRGP